VLPDALKDAMKAASITPAKGQQTEVEQGPVAPHQGGCLTEATVAVLDKDAQTEIAKAVEAAVQKASAPRSRCRSPRPLAQGATLKPDPALG